MYNKGLNRQFRLEKYSWEKSCHSVNVLLESGYR